MINYTQSQIIDLLIFETHLCILQLIEHLVVDLFYEISCQIDRSYSRYRGKCSSTNVVYVVVAEVQPPHESHSSEGVGV